MARSLRLRRLVTLLLLFALAAGGAACATGKPGKGMAYADVQKIQRGLTASQILDSFGPPAGMERGANGKIVSMRYVTVDGQSHKAFLLLGFDAREVLVSREFTGNVAGP